MNSETDEDNYYEFKARLFNPRTLLHVLQAIDLHDTAAVIISQYGIRFTVDKERGFQVSSFLEKNLFDMFQIGNEEESVMFRIGIRHLINSLNPLIDCSDRSNILTNDSDTNESNGSCIRIMYRELDGNTISVCREMTQEMNESNQIDLVDLPLEQCVVQCFLMSEVLRDVFVDLDMASEHLQISFDATNGLQFKTKSQYAEIESKILRKSPAFGSFGCEKYHQFIYPISVLKHSLKVLSQSKKTCIRISQVGLMCLQYQIILDRKTQVFVEYACYPVIDP